MAAAHAGTTIIDRLWPAESTSGALRAVTLIALGSVLLTASAKFQVPFWPVPMTMQTFAVLIIGATYGARLGGATVAVYLLQGAVGLPVFATGAGLAYMAGPTGGYLVGFLLAAIATGFMADRGMGRGVLSALGMFLIGDVLVFASGITWLSALIGLEKALAGGLYPFLPGEALKVALAMATLPLAWKAVARR